MKAWREIAVPHQDVLEGTFHQSEFAADITAVQLGKATPEYQDAAAFFQRTFITEGMRLLLTQVAQRLNGQAGEPVIQLQTAFGGGKTHTMLAVYHLATRTCALKDLAGIPGLLDKTGLMDIPKARVAVLDGHALSPGQPRLHGTTKVKTLWGELAYQLAGDEWLAWVAEADATGTSPGKEILRALLECYAPCVVLVDELVAYIRQFPDGQVLSGGTYDSNLSFLQALTEAAKLVPGAMVLASLPESEVEAGSSRGVGALKALEKTFGRVQALWKPVATEEAFEIVRRRLFEPIVHTAERDAVCRAFAKEYEKEGAKMPSETHEARYYDRLVQAYPIHPEVFDRLYEDWTTLQSFQRTRGVLKLMARVIHRLWKDENQDGMILPGSLPLYDSGTRNELTYYLPQGWDAVLERDIDGERAETHELDIREPRFGAVHAARRVARTLFLGSAPSSGGGTTGTKGMDRARVLLGCVQPEQGSAAFSDALNRLCDRLHYLNSSDDKAKDTTRFWFDTRANLRREMEDRKSRIDASHIRGKLAEVFKGLVNAGGLFDGVHVFTPHADIPDDSALRLVFLPPEIPFVKSDPQASHDAVLEMVRSNGSKPRYRSNRLVFIAADQAALSRLRDAACTALAWESIVTDIGEGRLNIDRLQEKQANKEWDVAKGVVPRAARETFKWLLCPVMTGATETKSKVESFPLNPGGSSYGAELERVCQENEIVIARWSPVHLRTRLQELYWKDTTTAVRAAVVWEDFQKYLYLPRLRNQGILEQVIQLGAATKEFFGTAYAQVGYEFEGFRLGDPNVRLDDTLLLVEPKAAAAYKAAWDAKQLKILRAAQGIVTPPPVAVGQLLQAGAGTATPTTGSTPSVMRAKRFFGSVEIPSVSAKLKLIEIAEEVIRHLDADPNASVKVTLEITAEFPQGISEQTKRTVDENAKALTFKIKTWE